MLFPYFCLTFNYKPISGTFIANAGSFRAKYNKYKTTIIAKQPFKSTFSPACGGNQNDSSVNIIIAKILQRFA